MLIATLPLRLTFLTISSQGYYICSEKKMNQLSQITITLPDNSAVEIERGTTVYDFVESSIGPSLAKAALAADFNGKQLDLSAKLNESGAIHIITGKNPEGIEIIRHSSAHLMAMAVKELFPGTLLTIGPTIENGFYYDFDSKHKFSPDDFDLIEKKMLELCKKDFSVSRRELNRMEAIEYYKTKDPDPYKVELMEEWTDESVSFYDQGDFTDLCRGPHVPSTGKLEHFKILSVAGAYWRGDEKRTMLQRLYATAFADKKSLKNHLHLLEEAKKRDHRVIGKQLDYFHIDEGSPGMVFWHAKGWKLYRLLEEYVTEKIENAGYQIVNTPEVINEELFRRSGHLEKFSDDMFLTNSEHKNFVIKPMNCPCHIEIFKKGITSFRDLPIRIAEFGKCHRNELAGTMHGLMRVRGFVQDDAHIFCTEDQVTSEVTNFCRLLQEIYNDFGFTDIQVKYSDRPEKRLGDDSVWDKAEAALKKAVESAGLHYELNPGEGAFYGPKLEFILRDSLGRSWQCGTIQVDFQLPERLGAYYIDEASNRRHPVMLHRAILGSLERFIGILIEEFAGDLPLWLNPHQIRILPISDKFKDFCLEICSEFKNVGLRAEVDVRNEKIGRKIRDGENNKIPYLVIVGEREVKNHEGSLRKRKVGDLGTFTIDEISEKLRFENSKKMILTEKEV